MFLNNKLEIFNYACFFAAMIEGLDVLKGIFGFFNGVTRSFRWAARSEAPRVLLKALVLNGSIVCDE
jgi:hypothetical protein